MRWLILFLVIGLSGCVTELQSKTYTSQEQTREGIQKVATDGEFVAWGISQLLLANDRVEPARVQEMYSRWMDGRKKIESPKFIPPTIDVLKPLMNGIGGATMDFFSMDGLAKLGAGAATGGIGMLLLSLLSSFIRGRLKKKEEEMKDQKHEQVKEEKRNMEATIAELEGKLASVKRERDDLRARLMYAQPVPVAQLPIQNGGKNVSI